MPYDSPLCFLYLLSPSLECSSISHLMALSLTFFRSLLKRHFSVALSLTIEFSLNIYLFICLRQVLVVACAFLLGACKLLAEIWDLVPRPRITPRPPALGAQSLSYWTTRETLATEFFITKFSRPPYPPLSYCVPHSPAIWLPVSVRLFSCDLPGLLSPPKPLRALGADCVVAV